MKKKIALIQMDVRLGEPDANYTHALSLMERAMEDEPDILVLPELFNTGFLPRPAERLRALSDEGGERTKELFSSFAKRCGVNIIAGSAAVLDAGAVYNRSYVFDRTGGIIASYDKIHGFSPVREAEFMKGGSHTVRFLLDGVPASMAICYDLRFPELIRTETLRGADLFFLPAAWPLARIDHWEILSKARAIENQMYVCAVNTCGMAGAVKYGGRSLFLSPWGETVCRLGETEEIRTGMADLDALAEIRERINVFRDRRPEMYHL